MSNRYIFLNICKTNPKLPTYLNELPRKKFFLDLLPSPSSDLPAKNSFYLPTFFTPLRTSVANSVAYSIRSHDMHVNLCVIER